MSFGVEFIQFLKDLGENNNREWFQNNRKTYLKAVKEPFAELVEEMILRIQAVDPEIQIEPKDAIFRINRDVRFSKDKTPYQTHVSAAIAQNGKKSILPGFYFQLNADHLWIVGGLYQIDRENLRKVREEIAYNREEFRSIIEHKDFRKHFGEIKGERNKVIPAEFKEAVVEEPLIANKQYYYTSEHSSSLALQPNLSDFLMQYYHWGQPLNRFFKRAITG